MSVLLLLLSLAQAATYPANLGENITLRQGDMAVVQFGNQASVISCGGAPLPPPQQDFIQGQVVNLSSHFQSANESDARLMCEMSLDSVVIQTGSKLEKIATNECLRSYANCRQLGKTTFEFVPRYQNEGSYGCYVKTIVRGIN